MDENEIIDLFRRAIVTRQRVLVSYADDRRGRLVEPHAVGTGLAGQYLASVFQVWGDSASGEGFGWKMLRIDRVRGVDLVPGGFCGPRAGFQPQRSGIANPVAML